MKKSISTNKAPAAVGPYEARRENSPPSGVITHGL